MIKKLINIALCVAIVSSTIGEAKAETKTNWTPDTFKLRKSIVQMGVSLPIATTIID